MLLAMRYIVYNETSITRVGRGRKQIRVIGNSTYIEVPLYFQKKKKKKVWKTEKMYLVITTLD